MSTSPNTLGRALRRFFTDHLPRVRGASSHTVQSYRDAFVLLLRFVATQRRAPVSDLDLSDLGPQEVLDFLQHLEAERHSVPATRNVRPPRFTPSFGTVLRASRPFGVMSARLAVPFKRARSRPVEYLEFDEIQAVRPQLTGLPLMAVVIMPSSRRCSIRAHVFRKSLACSMQLQTPPHVRLFGKGRKERVCPLWPQTAEILSAPRPSVVARRLPTILSSVIVMVPASPGSASATFSGNIVRELMR